MEEVNFVAPSSGGNGKFVKIENVEKIPPGMQFAILYSIADVGNQPTKMHGDKPKVILSFEFPQQQRVFYEGEEAKPKVISCTETFSMYKNARLRKHIEGMTGGPMSDADADKYNFAKLLGTPVIANITHSACGQYENINSFTPLYENNCAMFGVQDLAHAVSMRTNPTTIFHKSQGFDHANFGMLPKWIREKAMSSPEGKAFAAAGGVFAEKPKTNSNNMKLVLNDPNQTVEAFLSAGWTEQQIVDQGHGKWVASTPPPTALPQAPTPVAPQQPQAPTSGPKFVMIATDFTEEQYLASGWTRETMIANGKAKMVNPQPAAPQQPQAPASPQMPQAPAPMQAPAQQGTVAQMNPVDNLANMQATTPLAPAPTQPSVPATPQAPSIPPAANTAGGYAPPINGGGETDDLPF